MKATDEQIFAWAGRHCIVGTITAQREAFEDAQTLLPNHFPDATKMVKPLTGEEIRKMWHKEHKWHKSLSSFEWYKAGDDRCAATRLAVWKAALEIAKGMK